jgi:hypothetical protein
MVGQMASRKLPKEPNKAIKHINIKNTKVRFASLQEFHESLSVSALEKLEWWKLTRTLVALVSFAIKYHTS